MQQSGKLRVAVIGTGAFAQACHIPQLLAHPDVCLAVLCGSDATRTRALADCFGIAGAAVDPIGLCQRTDIDAVTICTSNAAHCEPVIAALRHGKHVLCEKPLAPRLEEARLMADAARISGRVHQVAFTYRHLYGVGELRRRVLAGDIGQPLVLQARHEYADQVNNGSSPSWRHGGANEGGGVLLDTCAHLLDLGRFILGPVATVRAELWSQGREGVQSDDIANVWLKHVSGAAAHFYASRVTPARSENFVKVVGRSGTLLATISRGASDRLHRLRVGSAAWEEVSLPEEAHRGQPHALARMMRSFVDGCRRSTLADEAASFEDGLAVQRLLSAAAEAANTQRERLFDAKI